MTVQPNNLPSSVFCSFY